MTDKSLYDHTGSIRDVNTILVPLSKLREMQAWEKSSRLALQTIADFPITDQRNMDATNMQRIAKIVLLPGMEEQQ